MTADQQPETPSVDLTSCEREAIHVPGHVQGFGCLIALASDWLITHASGNCADHLGLAPDRLVGSAFADHFPEEFVHRLRTRMQILSDAGDTARLTGQRLTPDGPPMDVAVHSADRTIIVEFEPQAADPDADDALAVVQRLMDRIGARADVPGMAREAARILRQLTGYDRVMVYRFEDDESGRVIAEDKRGDMTPFLDLRYPASDIPAQARALYVRSPIRVIEDVNRPVAPILPGQSASADPLDLSLAVTRAVSPIHLEYLRNMGVGASMSVSIVRDGRLWGLFACHHDTPHRVGQTRRTAVELFGRLFSYELIAKEAEADRTRRDRASRLHDVLMRRFSSKTDIVAAAPQIEREIAEVIAFDGMAIFVDGELYLSGAAPTEMEFWPLARFLNTASSNAVFVTENLGAVFDPAEAYADRVAGLLALPISRSPRDYVVLFRRELVRSVTWGGNPDKPASPGPNGLRLTPRKSFEAWSEIVKGRSAPWTADETRLAESLRITLLEVVLKLTDEANRARRRAEERQATLIAELNHRVRNILTLIQGLVAQSRHEAATLADYISVLDGRVHALARAHDQLTRQAWQASSLFELIDVETRAFADANRVHLDGPDVLMQPEALSTFALVIHELVTNAVKYGALGRTGGIVTVSTALDADGTLSLGWRETGGPPPAPRERRGFGSTIIEQSVPHELRGTAEVAFEADGLSVAFRIPPSVVEPAPHLPARAQETPETAPEPIPQKALDIGGGVLLVEDNMIIAVDLAETLRELGATQVHTAASVAEAREHVDRSDLKLALLDVDLGGETTLNLARDLDAAGLPFVLSTGYGAASLDDQIPADTPILRKPFDRDQLSRAIVARLAVG